MGLDVGFSVYVLQAFGYLDGDIASGGERVKNMGGWGREDNGGVRGRGGVGGRILLNERRETTDDHLRWRGWEGGGGCLKNISASE